MKPMTERSKDTRKEVRATEREEYGNRVDTPRNDVSEPVIKASEHSSKWDQSIQGRYITVPQARSQLRGRLWEVRI